ncbi:SDR family NAD(P)-dependent oxidoreductase [Paraburkholderia humisilvae]|uniref:3-oxoacyl-[acyl-carrier-protein] reductase FabG n=1 Tax=Paraburkholderia humisilvae TaxID=627669 RepID=A0A6J5F9H3_9BURK|nr:SDR family NAD(P)-dependent oxidoreductase [Paraburkholderia humisilvae]CAB3774441.1 3-oxoacyl-[acyl-carrier-protein] reductase FabG [Paraburkholderia humisilvae]
MQATNVSNGRVAVVTGAAGGIGSSVARRLARDGFDVVLAGRGMKTVAAVSARISEHFRPAAALALDVGSSASINEFFRAIDERFGRCDVLVNNAGVASLHPFGNFPLDEWRRIMEINVTGPLLLAQQAAQRMIGNGWGRVVNIASISGIRAGAGRTGYGTSKTALMGLTRQMAVELAPFGITANSVAPGPVHTPMTSVHSNEARQAYLRQIPMKRYGVPDEIAAAVAFFASEDASYVTGQTLAVDGGFVAAGILDA